MGPTRIKHTSLLSLGCVAAIAAGHVVSTEDAIILNPEGFGAHPGMPVVAALVVGLAVTVLIARIFRFRGSDDMAILVFLTPFCVLVAYHLMVAAVPAISLAVSATPRQVETTLISGGSQLDSSACSYTIKHRRPVIHVAYIDGQPPLLGRICLKPVRAGRNSAGQTVLTPPHIPDPGPILIEGPGNWFAVRVERLRAL